MSNAVRQKDQSNLCPLAGGVDEHMKKVLFILIFSFFLCGFTDSSLAEADKQDPCISESVPTFESPEAFWAYIDERDLEGKVLTPEDVATLGSFDGVCFYDILPGSGSKHYLDADYETLRYRLHDQKTDIYLTVTSEKQGNERWNKAYPEAAGMDPVDLRYTSTDGLSRYTHNNVQYIYQNGFLLHIQWFYGNHFYQVELMDVDWESFRLSEDSFLAKLLRADSAGAAIEDFSADHFQKPFLSRREKRNIHYIVGGVLLLLAGGAAGVIVYKKRKKAKA